jgi:hypothetical protein
MVYLAIIGTGGNQRVVERIPNGSVSFAMSIICLLLQRLPIGIENSSRVSSEQRDLLGEFSSLFKRNDRKGTATTGLPVHSQILRVDLSRG